MYWKATKCYHQEIFKNCFKMSLHADTTNLTAMTVGKNQTSESWKNEKSCQIIKIQLKLNEERSKEGFVSKMTTLTYVTTLAVHNTMDVSLGLIHSMRTRHFRTQYWDKKIKRHFDKNKFISSKYCNDIWKYL